MCPPGNIEQSRDTHPQSLCVAPRLKLFCHRKFPFQSRDAPSVVHTLLVLPFLITDHWVAFVLESGAFLSSCGSLGPSRSPLTPHRSHDTVSSAGCLHGCTCGKMLSFLRGIRVYAHLVPCCNCLPCLKIVFLPVCRTCCETTWLKCDK